MYTSRLNLLGLTVRNSGCHDAPELWASYLRRSASYETGIKAASDGGVGCALDDRPSIGKQRHFIRFPPELEDKVVMTNLTMWRKLAGQKIEVNRTLTFVDLNRVPATERYVRPGFTRKVDEVALIAAAASLSWPCR